MGWLQATRQKKLDERLGVHLGFLLWIDSAVDAHVKGTLLLREGGLQSVGLPTGGRERILIGVFLPTHHFTLKI